MMDTEKIINANIKIALFMNAGPVKPMNGELDLNTCRWIEPMEKYWPSWVIHPVLSSNLCYNSSWDWLMPVIDKISRIPLLNADGSECTEPCDTCHPYTFNMADDDGNRLFRYKGFQLHKAKELIKAAFMATVEFIDWYNEKTNTPKLVEKTTEFRCSNYQIGKGLCAHQCKHCEKWQKENPFQIPE